MVALHMDQVAPLHLSREAFYQWADEQPSGRHERVFGEVVRMAPERWRHNLLKGHVFRAFQDCAIGTDMQVVIDGVGVAVDDHDFIPDVVVHQGPPMPLDAMIVPTPVIIVEVLSPTTARFDASVKLEAYFHLPSLRHYLRFDADRRAVTHWPRGRDAAYPAAGALRLDPPGLTVDLGAIYDRAGIA